MMNAIYAFRFEVTRKASRYDVLLIFAATRDLDPEALATAIESEVERNLVPDDTEAVGGGFAKCRDSRAAGWPG